MNTWIKHPKDAVCQKTISYKGKTVLIKTGSRHDATGNVLGYILLITDTSGYRHLTFKHYRYRDVVEIYAETAYKMGFPA